MNLNYEQRQPNVYRGKNRDARASKLVHEVSNWNKVVQIFTPERIARRH